MTRDNHLSLALLSDGGVLLDLQSGGLFQLNEAAAFVWDRHLNGEPPASISRAFSDRFGVGPDRAERDVYETLNQQRPSVSTPPISAEFRYRHSREVCDFSVNGIPVLEMTPSGDAIRTCVDPDSNDLYQHLRAVSPKILALQGTFVLHSSAVQSSARGLTVFVGESGAGKTTTARAFARAGMRLVCEDKLILRPTGECMLASLDAESTLERRLVDLHSCLKHSTRGHWCDMTFLADTAAGANLPIERFLMVDKRRRGSAQSETKRMGESDALIGIFVNAFHGSSLQDEWHRQFAAASALARATPVFLATVPNGVELLGAAARRYSDQVVS